MLKNKPKTHSRRIQEGGEGS